MLTQAIRVHRHGGPEVLQLETIEVPVLQPGQVLLQQQAIGLNYADIYQRQGEAGPHDDTAFPFVPGSLGAGVVAAVGPQVDTVKVGDRVGCIQPGSYAQWRVVPAWRAVRLPEAVSSEIAAAWLLRGLTAEYLLHRLYPVRAGDWILIHAAAGGMGIVLSQWASALGAKVIGTVGSAAKAQVALHNGCHAVINYTQEDFAARVLQITGEGVSVVYDAVGKAVFLASLGCLKTRGMAINFGTASGNVQAFDLQTLHKKSLTVCRPTLRSFIATPTELAASARLFFDALASGALTLPVSGRYALHDVRVAHEDLEQRRTTGAAILLP